MTTIVISAAVVLLLGIPLQLRFFRWLDEKDADKKDAENVQRAVEAEQRNRQAPFVSVRIAKH